MNMDEITLRTFILAVLDDEYGISETAYLILKIILHENPNLQYLESYIRCTDGRYYLSANAAQEMINNEH